MLAVALDGTSQRGDTDAFLRNVDELAWPLKRSLCVSTDVLVSRALLRFNGAYSMEPILTMLAA